MSERYLAPFDDLVCLLVDELQTFTLIELTEEVIRPTDPELPGWAATEGDVWKSLNRLRRRRRIFCRYDRSARQYEAQAADENGRPLR